MAVTVASFRADFLEFQNESDYPSSVIAYWLAAAAILLGIPTVSPPTVCSFTGAIANGVLTVSEINFGSLTMFPMLLEGENVPDNVSIIKQLTGPAGTTGTYQLGNAGATALAAENMVALRPVVGAGINQYWGVSSPLATSPPTTLADLATEQWVAHQIVLEKQAIAAAASGGNPGTSVGVISSKSVNGVSVSFDVGSVTGGLQETAGYYNQTTYGQRFYRLMRLRGAGPIQLGIGRAPPFLFFNTWGLLGSSNGWAGPYPGVEMGDTGFSS